ncbi:hypothetical protein BJX99DRAFT_218767 [Aspergillus californicus]
MHSTLVVHLVLAPPRGTRGPMDIPRPLVAAPMPVRKTPAIKNGNRSKYPDNAVIAPSTNVPPVPNQAQTWMLATYTQIDPMGLMSEKCTRVLTGRSMK